MAVEPNKPVYPTSDLDRADTILSFLGSLWATSYQGQHQVADLINAKTSLERQTQLDLLELVASTSRFEIPLFHTDNWYQLRLAESGLNTGTSALPKYGDGFNYEPGSIFYDTPIAQTLNIWDLDEDLVEVPMLLNRISEASLTLTDGTDYVVEDNAIKFRENPFDNPLIAKRDIIDSEGNIVDRELSLWVYRGQWDFDLVYRQFGYVLQLHMESDQNYKDLINAVMDALVEGSAVDHLEQIMSAVTGIPLTKEDGEVVERVISESGRNLVITSKHVYQFSTSATITVSVGDTVNAGDPLSDGLLFYDMGRGDTPPVDKIPGLTTGRGFLAEGYFGDLTWQNADVTLNREDVDGRVKVSWELGGWPGDVEKFFDDLHAKGLADGTTLAQLLDTRPNPSGEPPLGALPATINPVQFLSENVLRNNGLVTVIQIDEGVNGVGLEAARILRKVIPPHVLLLLVVTVPYTEDPITMEGAGSDTAPGYEESTISYSAGATSETIDGLTSVSETVTVRNIRGRCA